MNQPRVSIIVLTYNQQATIARALDSLVSQHCDFTFEIQLTDDCSVDYTADICREYADRYPELIRFHRNETNLGVVRNYFETLARCRGELIADCAGDDCWLGNDSLQARVDLLDRHPETALVHAPWLCLDVATGETSPCGWDEANRPPTNGRSLLRLLLEHHKPQTIHLSTAVYRAEVIRKALRENPETVYNEEFGCEDLPVMAALLSVGDAVWYPRPTLLYSVGGRTISRPGDFARSADFYRRSTLATATLARTYGVPLAYLRDSLKRLSYFTLTQAIHSGNSQLIKRTATEFAEAGIPVSALYRLRLFLKR